MPTHCLKNTGEIFISYYGRDTAEIFLKRTEHPLLPVNWLRARNWWELRTFHCSFWYLVLLLATSWYFQENKHIYSKKKKKKNWKHHEVKLDLSTHMFWLSISVQQISPKLTGLKQMLNFAHNIVGQKFRKSSAGWSVPDPCAIWAWEIGSQDGFSSHF